MTIQAINKSWNNFPNALLTKTLTFLKPRELFPVYNTCSYWKKTIRKINPNSEVAKKSGLQPILQVFGFAISESQLLSSKLEPAGSLQSPLVINSYPRHSSYYLLSSAGGYNIKLVSNLQFYNLGDWGPYTIKGSYFTNGVFELTCYEQGNYHTISCDTNQESCDTNQEMDDKERNANYVLAVFFNAKNQLISVNNKGRVTIWEVANKKAILIKANFIDLPATYPTDFLSFSSGLTPCFVKKTSSIYLAINSQTDGLGYLVQYKLKDGTSRCVETFSSHILSMSSHGDHIYCEISESGVTCINLLPDHRMAWNCSKKDFPFIETPKRADYSTIKANDIWVLLSKYALIHRGTGHAHKLPEEVNASKEVHLLGENVIAITDLTIFVWNAKEKLLFQRSLLSKNYTYLSVCPDPITNEIFLLMGAPSIPNWSYVHLVKYCPPANAEK